MKYFRFYVDDTMRPVGNHDYGYMVNRKPIIMSFLRQKPKPWNGRRGASTRKGNAFVKRLQFTYIHLTKET